MQQSPQKTSKSVRSNPTKHKSSGIKSMTGRIDVSTTHRNWHCVGIKRKRWIIRYKSYMFPMTRWIFSHGAFTSNKCRLQCGLVGKNKLIQEMREFGRRIPVGGCVTIDDDTND